MATVNPKGISFPFRFSSSGGVRLTSGVTKVKDNLACLATTAVNERLIRKRVGTIGYTTVLRNLNSATARSATRDLIQEALVRYERRAIILAIRVIGEETEAGMSTFVEVDFIYKATGEQSSVRTQIA